MINTLKNSKIVLLAIQKMLEPYTSEFNIENVAEDSNPFVYKITTTYGVFGIISLENLAKKLKKLIYSQDALRCIFHKIGGTRPYSEIKLLDTSILCPIVELEKYIKDSPFDFICDTNLCDYITIDGIDYFIYDDYHCNNSEMGELIYVLDK